MSTYTSGSAVVSGSVAVATYGLVATHYPFADFPSDGVELAAVDVQFTAPLADVGFGSVTLRILDSYANTPEPGDIFGIDTVGFTGDRARAFAFIFRDAEYIVLDPSEEVGQVVTFKGPGHLSILSDGRVQPPGGVGRFPFVTDFRFDYTHVSYTEGAEWVAATEVVSVEAAKNYYTPFTTTLVTPGVWPIPWAQDMPADAVAGVGSGTTMIIWASDGTTTSAGLGTCYFRDTFTATYDGLHAVFFTADNVGTLYIDGKEICSAGDPSFGGAGADIISDGGGNNVLASGFTHTAVELLSLSAGVHTVAIEATNWPSFTGESNNPAGIAAAIYIPGYPPTLMWETTSAMRVDEYPAETPGMSAANDMRLFLEAQTALGRLSYINLTATDTLDTDSVAWADLPTLSVKAGTDDGQSLTAKITSLYADVSMDPASWDLSMWNYQTRDPASGVTFEVGNLTSLRFKRQDLSADEELILSGIGWSRDGSLGRREGYLELGPENNEFEVGRVGDLALDVFSNPLEETELTYKPRDDTEIPWLNTNFVPGADVTCPTRAGGTTTDRAVQIGCAFNSSDEVLLVTVSVKDLVAQDQERMLNAIREASS